MVEITGKQLGDEPSATVDFARHFSLLGAIVAVLTATSAWRPAFGAIVWFGIYGALHSSAVALTWRGPQPLWRLLMFVAVAAALSMLSAAVSLYATRHSVSLSAMGPALPLALSSGLGALGYALWFRWLDAQPSWRAYVLQPLGCIVATMAILATGAYRYGDGHGGALWFAAAWWLAFSTGLWLSRER
jgi:hypothetical protein